MRPTRSRIPARVPVAMISGEDQSMTELIARADKALYKAKAAGRGRVVAWSDQCDVDINLQCVG